MLPLNRLREVIDGRETLGGLSGRGLEVWRFGGGGLLPLGVGSAFKESTGGW